MRNPTESAQKLLDAALVEFASRGFHGAGVDRIADHAGINKRMIYHYFGDKAGLFRALVEARLGHWDGGALSDEDAQLLVCEAQWLAAGGGPLPAQEARRAALSKLFGGAHAGVQLATLGVRLLPALLPQLVGLLGLEETPDLLAEQVRQTLTKASEKQRVTLRADTT